MGEPVDWSRLSRVLVVRLDNLGDVVLTGPLIRAVAAASPQAEVDLLCSPAGASVAPLLPGVADVLTERAPWQDTTGAGPSPDALLALVDRIRGGSYQAALLSTSFSQSPWPAATVLALAGVGVRVGQSAEFGGSLLSHWVQPGEDDLLAHQVDRSLRMAAAVGIPAAGTDLRLDLPATAHRRAQHVLDGHGVGGRFAVVAPGASCPSRRYAPDRLAAVVEQLDRSGLPVVVVGTEAERALVHQVAGSQGTAVSGALDVPALAATLAAATVVVTMNSGCMHLADAVRTPQVVLFAGTETPSQFAPRSGPAVLLSRPVGCSPCRTFVCPFHQECLDVDPAEVVAAALGLAADRRAA